MRKSWKTWVAAAALLTAMPLLAQQTAKEAEREAGSGEQYDKLLRRTGNHEILARLEGNWQGNLKANVFSDDPKQRRPDISLAQSRLGWKPKVPLREGLKQTIEYFDALLSKDAAAAAPA